MNADTRTILLNAADGIVRQFGYAGFSYADLAAGVGIRKSSIHHHFPAKEDLGVALVEAYATRFAEALDGISAASPYAPERLGAYAGLYRDALRGGLGCLCGVLAAELAGLPERLRGGVRRFFEENMDWLAGVLADGQRAGLIRRDQPARAQASVVLAGLQGAMLVGRAVGSDDAFDGPAGAILNALRHA